MLGWGRGATSATLPDPVTLQHPPAYLPGEDDRAIWRALAAALAQVRQEATNLLLHPPVELHSLFDGNPANPVDERVRTELIPRALAQCARTLPPGISLPPFAAEVIFSSLRGYAELDPLFLDPRVTEVIVDGPDQEVCVERDGHLINTGLMLSRDRLRYLIERIAGDASEPLSDAHPIMEVHLPKARATAVHERIVPRGPSLVVRLRARRTIERAELIASGTIPEPLWEALAATYRGGANMLIAGETSSGKTTLLQTLLAALPEERRIVTIEDPIEIDLPRQRLLQMEVRGPRLGGGSTQTQRDLVRLSLRLRPDHVIVGEVRDGAAWDMVDAMSLGQSGSLATIHAGTPQQALLRLESLCLRADDVPPLPAVQRAIADAVNLLVQIRRVPIRVDGRPAMHRAVTAIYELTGLSDPSQPGGPYALTPLALLQQGTLVPTSSDLSPLLATKLEEAGERDLFGA